MSLVPDYIKNLSPYKAGKPIDQVQRELGFKNAKKLSWNMKFCNRYNKSF